MLSNKLTRQIGKSRALACLVVVILISLLVLSSFYLNEVFQTRIKGGGLQDPFPVSVNSHTKTISIDPALEAFLTNNLALSQDRADNWLSRVASVLVSKSWHQNLASPVSKTFVIWPGQRKEEVLKHIAAILSWDELEIMEFEKLVYASFPVIPDGKYFPGCYVTHNNATPAEVKQLIKESFTEEVLNRYTAKVESKVPLESTLVIASLIEREASDFENMREVSGVIWNRLFIDMPLQLDATLQYARGSNPNEGNWWPVVKPRDKFLTSPFNTYQNAGLPPSPISNPSTESIIAALNPIKTTCLFYFHTDEGEYFCSVSYEAHVSKLRSLYGRGS